MFFSAFLLGMLFTASFFSMIIYVVTNYANTGHIPLDAFFVLTALIATVSLVGMISLLNEKRWIEAFGITKIMSTLDFEHSRQTERAVAREHFDEEYLRRLIETVIDDKISTRTKPKETAIHTA